MTKKARNGRGGPRPNSGRPLAGDEPMDASIAARVTQSQRAVYDALGASEWLREALDASAAVLEKKAAAEAGKAGVKPV